MKYWLPIGIAFSWPCWHLVTCINTRSLLKQGLCPQSWVILVEFDIMFFTNRDICEEFIADKHYACLACNRPSPLFRQVVDCYKGYTILACVRDEKHPNQFGWWMHRCHPILFQLAPTFVKLRWSIAVQAPKIWVCSTPIWVGTPKKVSNGQSTQHMD